VLWLARLRTSEAAIAIFMERLPTGSELPFGDVMNVRVPVVCWWQEVLWPIVFALVPEQPNETGFVRALTARRHCFLCFGQQ
jgi:hypothetical protein